MVARPAAYDPNNTTFSGRYCSAISRTKLRIVASVNMTVKFRTFQPVVQSEIKITIKIMNKIGFKICVDERLFMGGAGILVRHRSQEWLRFFHYFFNAGAVRIRGAEARSHWVRDLRTTAGSNFERAICRSGIQMNSSFFSFEGAGAEDSRFLNFIS